MQPEVSSSALQWMQQGDALRKAGDLNGAVIAYLQGATDEHPPAALCLRLMRSLHRMGDNDQARRWAFAAMDEPAIFTHWQAASSLLAMLPPMPNPARTVRVAVLGSHTTTQFTPLLCAALARLGIAAEMFESNYGQYQQDILDPASGLYAFDPDLILLAVHHGELHLPDLADDPQQVISQEVDRWRKLWQTLRSRSRARIIQHLFALPDMPPLGHLSMRIAGSWQRLAQQVNLQLSDAAGNDLSVVDCDRLAGSFGKSRWFDWRFWHMSRQALSLDSLPMLASHTAAVMAADLGLSRKCLALDLDNTLWGGVIGEDGLSGIKLGPTPDGEAFIHFQNYILQLKKRGIILAVCSKNNPEDAREPFLKHPEMRLKLDDFAVFIANWQPKSDNLREIARTLNIGLDAIVFADDNPAERQIIRQLVPQVHVLTLPTDPAGYTRALAECLALEPATFTAEDSQRAEQYQARTKIAELEASSTDIESFQRDLAMEASLRPFDEIDLPRIVQLIGKTNQFNLTTRRHTLADVQAMMADDRCVHFSLRLKDRFVDHGLVSLMIAMKHGHHLEIDTWLMSCRVIGRTVEATMLAHLCQLAADSGCSHLRGVYIPTAKNVLVQDLYKQFGFTLTGHAGEQTFWEYDLTTQGPITNNLIAMTADLQEQHP